MNRDVTIHIQSGDTLVYSCEAFCDPQLVKID